MKETKNRKHLILPQQNHNSEIDCEIKAAMLPHFSYNSSPINKTLTNLDMSDNGISDAGATCIALNSMFLLFV